MPAGVPGSSAWGSDRQASGPLVSTAAELGGGVLLAVGLLTPLATAALIAQSLVIVGLVHLPKGFWNSNGGVEFPLSLAAGVVALAGTGSGSASLDAALGLSYSAEVRGCSWRSGSSAPSSASRFRTYGQSTVRRPGHASAAQAGGMWRESPGPSMNSHARAARGARGEGGAVIGICTEDLLLRNRGPGVRMVFLTCSPEHELASEGPPATPVAPPLLRR